MSFTGVALFVGLGAVVGVAGETRLGNQVLLLANLSDESRHVTLPQSASVRRLDEQTFESATGEPDWLRSGEPEHCSVVALSACAVAFVELPAPGKTAGQSLHGAVFGHSKERIDCMGARSVLDRKNTHGEASALQGWKLLYSNIKMCLQRT